MFFKQHETNNFDVDGITNACIMKQWWHLQKKKRNFFMIEKNSEI